MPSPSPIPRSSSYPNISSSSSAKNHRFVLHPSSNSNSRSRSVCSARSSHWPRCWSNTNQLGNFIIPGRKSNDSSSKHSDLTEESLEAHNRRNAPILVHNSRIFDARNYAKCSPYYKGLTDASLAINREKILIEPAASSPGRESHATTMGAPSTTSSSLSSFIVKMQEWSSCFTFKYTTSNKQENYQAFNYNNSNNNNNNNTNAAATTTFTATTSNEFTSSTAAKKQARTASSTASSSTGKTASCIKEEIMKISNKEVDAVNNALLLDNNKNNNNINEEKPLRERVSELGSDSTLPPPKKSLFDEFKDVEKKLLHDTCNIREDQEMIKNQREFIWANKYQPKILKDFICNRDRAIQLQDLVKEGGHGNFIFEGPPGVGKKTMIRAMLREAFGPDRVQTRDERKVFDLKGEARGSIQVNIKESSQHIEVNLSDLRGYEKHVIVELMKETQSKISSKSNVPENTRAIILCEADKLSTDALLYMRWLLERYKGLNKVFFCCSDVSKLQPIKSLCTVIQLLSPSKQEIVEVLEFIAKQEGIELPRELAEKIADNSKNNFRQAIRSFEASWQMNYSFVEDQVILTGWEDDITNIAKKIIEEQSPKQLYIIRGKLQNLIEHDVCLHFIFLSLIKELKRHLDVGLHHQLEGLYDEYKMYDGFDNENPFVFGSSRYEETGKRLNDSMRNKNVQHFLRIEEFIAKFMSWYKITAKNYSCEPQDPASIKGPY